MWRTPSGERVLVNAEARAFAAAVWDLVGCIEPSSDSGAGPIAPRVFQRLTGAQQVAALSIVTHALLRPEIACPKLSAELEGTIAAVYENLRESVSFEMDQSSGAYWRQRVRDAVLQADAEDVPGADCTDSEIWVNAVDSLEAGVLHDADHDLGHIFGDLPPEHARTVKASARIPDDYFSESVPDPRPDEATKLHDELVQLCRHTLGEDAPEDA